MSHYGVARDLQTFCLIMVLNLSLKKISTAIVSTEGEHGFELEVEDSALCPRYISVIENVKNSTFTSLFQDRLKAIGLSPINNVVDITNYILHGLGQPLRCFWCG